MAFWFEISNESISSSLGLSNERRKIKKTIFLHSKEGVTQGCVLAMIGYGLNTLPMARKLKKEHPNCDSLWYADDGSVMDSHMDVHDFFKNLCKTCLSYGYFPEESKSIFVVKEQDSAKASSFCSSNDLTFTVQHGSRYLGSFVG